MLTDMSIDKLFNTVVSGGYCIGCGACTAIPNSPIRIKMDEYGCYQAMIDNSYIREHDSYLDVLKVCPFSDESINEDQISKALFGDKLQFHERIGYYITTYGGYVKENTFREHGSSGGMGTWILAELFKKGLIDAVIHVKPKHLHDNSKILFKYTVSRSLEHIRLGAKSRYYPVELSQVLSVVRNQPGRYAIVGLPCFIKAVRLLAEYDDIIKSRIHFCIGLICGHLKSTRFADMFAWQFGIKPDELKNIDFRVKIPERRVINYGVKVQGIFDNEEKQTVRPARTLYGSNWGLCFFKYQACDYCDDVMAETADISIGDAWLPRYNQDSGGTNVVVIRNHFINNIIDEAIASKRLHLELITADEVALSQNAGLRHRREGLAYRLWLKDRAGEWRPRKRVQASRKIDPKTIKKMVYRMEMAEKSHIAFSEAISRNSFEFFSQQMTSIVNKYESIFKKPLWRRVASLIKRILKGAISLFSFLCVNNFI